MNDPPQPTAQLSATPDSTSLSAGEDGEGSEPSRLIPGSTKGNNELELINILEEAFKSTTSPWTSVDYSDDCAKISPPRGRPLLVTTDSIIEGVHFETVWDSYEQIGAQAAVVNLSDLAASGAEPIALLWSLSLPPTLSADDVRALSQGFGAVAHEANCPVVGGNIACRAGSLEVHVTAIGSAYDDQVNRTNAQSGDIVYVTGTIGLRALGYLMPSHRTRALRHQWRPHLEESKLLCDWGKVTSMIDISDGLAIDASRLAETSDVLIDLKTKDIPIAKDDQLASSDALEAAMFGGEDYVLLFTSPASEPPPPTLAATPIGQCLPRVDKKSNDLSHLMIDGIPLSSAALKSRGFLHSLEGRA